MSNGSPVARKAGVTLRAILIGLVLIPVNCYWVFMTEIIRYQGHPTTISIFYNSIFCLLVLVAVNGLIRRVRPAWVLAQSELLSIYVMVNIGSALVGHDTLQILVSLIPYPSYMATPENNWASLIVHRLPDWLVVKDPYAIKNFYLRGDFFEPGNFMPWVKPVLCWSAFVVVLSSMFLCINVLLRKRWTDDEKLSFPLVQLPLEMTTEGSPLFKRKMLWLGFGIVAGLDIVNGIHVLVPSVAEIPIRYADLNSYITTYPLNALGWIPCRLYPFGIGLGVLLPLDLLFSCWFFFWVWRFESVFAAVFGVDSVPNMPFVNEQSFGAYVGIAVFALLLSRRHIWQLIRHFFGRKANIDDRGEAFPYRLAMWGLLLGSAFLFIFASAAGMAWQFILAFFVIYFLIILAITRMRAELGPPAHDLHAAGPDHLIPSILGPKAVGPQTLTVFSLLFWMNRAYRSHPMPFQLEGFRMAEKSRMRFSGMAGVIMIATGVGTVVAFLSILHLLYRFGAASSSLGPPNVPLIFGQEPWQRMDGWLKVPAAPDTNRAMAVAVGFVFTLILDTLRIKLGWFPFHPVGYAVSSSWSMTQLWMSLFTAWAVKLIILRYGGLKLYRRAAPFFLGVILAECTVGSLWTIFGIIFQVRSYAFWP